MITIYHASKEIFSDSSWFGYEGIGLSMEEIIVKFQNGEYFKAGELNTNDLDAAYGASQNLSLEAWMEGQRSTSVGDIIENDEGFHIVDRAGFLQIIKKGAA
jgi:hypothetical protein